MIRNRIHDWRTWLRRRRSARIAISILSRCVCGPSVGAYVSVIKRKHLIGMTWNLAQYSSPRHSIEACWFWVQKVKVHGDCRAIISIFFHLFTSVERMQQQSSNFVHKCTTGGYCLRIKNYAGMRRVSQNIIFRKIHPADVQSDEKGEIVFRWHFVQGLVHSVMSLQLCMELAWNCISTECTYWFITLRAGCGAVYCNRSCLWVCLWVCLITTITRNCVHRSSPNWVYSRAFNR